MNALSDYRQPSVRACVCFFSLTVAIAAHAADPILTKREWTVDGHVREALTYVPPSATTSDTPVVFAFHGHGGNMNNVARRFAYQSHWPEAIAVYMQGLPTPGKFGPDGQKPGWQKLPGDQDDRDLHFFDTVLATLKKEYRIDSNRIYATGHSNGGGFTYLLWAVRGDVFAAVAPSAGGAARVVANLKPLPALHVAGEKDEIVAFEFQVRTMTAVRALNGCEAEGQAWAQEGDLVAMLYPSKTGTPFVSVIYPGTHRFPDKAPELITRFFKEHARN